MGYLKKKKEVRDGSLVALEEDLGFSLIWALSQMLSIIPVLASSDLRGHEACRQERHAVTRKSTQMLASGKTWGFLGSCEALAPRGHLGKDSCRLG